VVRVKSNTFRRVGAEHSLSPCELEYRRPTQLREKVRVDWLPRGPNSRTQKPSSEVHGEALVGTLPNPARGYLHRTQSGGQKC